MHRTIKARAPQLLSLALEPRVPQEKPLQQEARTPELESSPHSLLYREERRTEVKISTTK